jgi:hypothetical protein
VISWFQNLRFQIQLVPLHPGVPMEALRKVLEEDVLPTFQRVFMKESSGGGGGGGGGGGAGAGDLGDDQNDGNDAELEKLQKQLWTPEHTGRLTAAIQEQVRRAVVGAG